MSKLNNRLWSMADSMRHKSSMESNEFKNYILGLMFFKFISDKNEKFYLNKIKEDGFSLEEAFKDEEIKKALIRESQKELGYAFEYEGLYSTLISNIKMETYSNEQLDESIRNFNDNIASTEDFSQLFSDLRLNDIRLGQEQKEKNDVIASIMNQLQDIESEEGVFDSDILGDAYEYLISKFASNAGKKAGEFYTPQSISKLLSKIVTNENNNIKDIYDPTCGSGSLLIRVAKDIKEKGNEYGSINGQEIINTTYNLARMNMIIHGIDFKDFHIALGDTIKSPDSKQQSKRYDAIVSNPPYGVRWDSPKELLNDNRFYKYGAIAPKGAMELSFVQHIESLLSDKGVAAILLPVGVLFRTGAENKILRKLIDDKILDTVILLSGNMFTSTSIPVVCLVLKKCKTNDGVFLIDATDLSVKENKKNILEQKHIDEIIDLYSSKKETRISKMLDMETIKENSYNLNITRYIQRVEEKQIDIDKVGKEIKDNLIKLRELEELIESDIKNIKELL
ncbi:MAG: type I restriction-modification system subunit M [Mycoplasmatales bacterium]|nr:type I restriction-modification system subunit M [Mycoplasmatales bacterium]